MRVFKLVGSCSLLVAAVVSGASTAAAFSSTDKARVLYVGDSLAANTLDTVAFFVASTGKGQVMSSIPGVSSGSIFPGMAICDFLDNTPTTAVTKLTPLIQGVKPHLVVMQFWGNLTACMGNVAFNSEDYFNTYFWNAAVAVTQITAAAQAAHIPRPKILWVLQGPDKDNKERTHRLNDIYAAIAQNAGDRTTDAGWGISMAAYPFDDKPKDRYAWTQFLPCMNFELGTAYCTNPTNAFNVPLTKLHLDNDAVHFCISPNPPFLFFGCDTPSPSILRYSLKIAGDADAWLGI